MTFMKWNIVVINKLSQISFLHIITAHIWGLSTSHSLCTLSEYKSFYVQIYTNPVRKIWFGVPQNRRRLDRTINPPQKTSVALSEVFVIVIVVHSLLKQCSIDRQRRIFLEKILMKTTMISSLFVFICGFWSLINDHQCLMPQSKSHEQGICKTNSTLVVWVVSFIIQAQKHLWQEQMTHHNTIALQTNF